MSFLHYANNLTVKQIVIKGHEVPGHNMLSSATLMCPYIMRPVGGGTKTA